MDASEIPLLAMLRNRMGYLNQRQHVIAENVANADTHDFAPHDLKPFSFDAKLQAAAGATIQAVTQPGHMQAASALPAGARSLKTKDSETTLSGNSVVLEDEMAKMTDSRMNYEAAVTFYQQSLNLLRTAIRAPGRG